MQQQKSTSQTQTFWTRTIKRVGINVVSALESNQPSFKCPVFGTDISVPKDCTIGGEKVKLLEYGKNEYKIVRSYRYTDQKYFYTFYFIKAVKRSFVFHRMFAISDDLSTMILFNKAGVQCGKVTLSYVSI